MGNEIFEEIKKKYKKSNKYMLCVSYEDIGILIQIIEKQSKEIEELKASAKLKDRQEYSIKQIAKECQDILQEFGISEEE